MTITVPTTAVDYLGNGAATLFAWQFNIPDADSITVSLIEVATEERTILNASQYLRLDLAAKRAGLLPIR